MPKVSRISAYFIGQLDGHIRMFSIYYSMYVFIRSGVQL